MSILSTKHSTFIAKTLLFTLCSSLSTLLHAQPVDHTSANWVNCAGEWQSCSVPVPALVRYGANGTYLTQPVTDSVSCNNSSFGGG